MSLFDIIVLGYLVNLALIIVLVILFVIVGAFTINVHNFNLIIKLENNLNTLKHVKRKIDPDAFAIFMPFAYILLFVKHISGVLKHGVLEYLYLLTEEKIRNIK